MPFQIGSSYLIRIRDTTDASSPQKTELSLTNGVDKDTHFGWIKECRRDEIEAYIIAGKKV